MKKKSNNKTLIVVIILIILFITIIYLFSLYNSNSNVKKGVKKKTSELKKQDDWYVPSGEASKIEIYKSDANNYPVFIKDDKDTSYKTNTLYKMMETYRCDVSSCKTYGYNDYKNEVIIKDDGYIIYNYETNRALKLSMPDAEYNTIDFMSYENEDYGLSVSNINGMYAFYSLKSNSFKTDFKYTNIFTSNSSSLIDNCFIAAKESEGKTYVVNYNTGKEIKESEAYLGSFGNGKEIYYFEDYGDIERNAIIYDKDFNKVLDGSYDLFSSTKSGNLVVRNNDESFSIYTKEGKLVKKSKNYKKVLLILNDYVIIKDTDDYLKIVNTDGSLLAKYAKLQDNSYLDMSLSGFYKSGETLIYLFVNKDDGIIRYSYNIKTKETKAKEYSSIN